MAIVRSSILISCLVATAASAQSPTATLPIERFRVPVDDSGFGTTEGGGVPPHLSLATALVIDDALNPLVITDEQGARVSAVVGNRLGASFTTSLGLFDHLSVGAELPLALLQNSGELGAIAGIAGAHAFAVTGVGDLKIVPKIRLLRESKHLVSLALLPAFSLPTASGVDVGTGSLEYGGSYLGEGPGAFAFLPELALSTNVQGVRLAANLGYRMRAPVSYLGAFAIYSEIGFRLGAGYDLHAVLPQVDGLLVFAELFGATADQNPFGLVVDDALSPAEQQLKAIEVRLQNPLEWSTGARWTLWPGMSLEAGLGAGILPGFGSPDLRAYAGARYAFEDRDEDLDGVKDSVDACRAEAEDKDGFEDANGCPDFDNDSDSVIDTEDRCRDVPGLPAHQGCPPPDRDRDTVVDDRDPCPDAPGTPENGGCPDGDGDGLIDGVDACPNVAGPAERKGCPPPPDGDKDGVEDSADLCPDRAGDIKWQGCGDKDNDGVPDNLDKCPTELETVNGIDDGDGCPDQGKVIVKGGRIETLEPVLFDGGKATIKRESNDVLDQIAQVLNAHAEIKLSVEGHTDSDGSAEKNLDLSERRAGAVVDALVSRGVDTSRMTSVGFGDMRPLTSNMTRRGKAQNRRVELVIVGGVRK